MEKGSRATSMMCWGGKGDGELVLTLCIQPWMREEDRDQEGLREEGVLKP